MLISLQLVGTPQGPVTDEPMRSFDDGMITIGRAPNCHVVLPDGLRIISRQHARIETQGQDLLLCCLSASAPVHVGRTPVPQGAVVPLRGGERIRIGGFELQVEVEEDRQTPSLAAEETVLDLLLPEGPDPGADADLTLSALPPIEPATPVAARRPGLLPPHVLPHPPPHPPAHAAPPVVAPGSVPAAPKATAPSPLPQGSRPAPASAPLAPPARARIDEWFDLGTAAPAPALRAGSASAAQPLPDAPNLPDLLLPGDDAPASGAAGGAGAASAAAPATASAPATGPATDQFGRLTNVPSEPRSAPSIEVASASPEAPAKVTARAATPAATSLPEGLSEAILDDLVAAFLEGAGLASQTSTTSARSLPALRITPSWMRHLGALLRSSVDGVLSLLHSRSAIKREMRAEVTVIGRRQNNPLKFAPDATAALAHLVGSKRTPSFLEPVAAMKDAHEDLLVHHLAVVAGMRAAMFELIARVGPEAVMHDEGPPKGLSMTIPTLHEAALWRRHCQRHRELVAHLDDDFEAVFGREFTKAYEAQARLVREQPPIEGPTG